MQDFWTKTQEIYPATIDGNLVSYDLLKKEMHCFLNSIGVGGRTFTHFGLIVENIDDGITELSKKTGTKLTLAKKTWVDIYNVNVGRLKEVELELVEPVGDSIFLDYLKKHGQSLHHLSYTAESLEAINVCLEKMRKGYAESIDENPHKGGKLALIKPVKFDPIWIEYGFTAGS